MAATIPYTTSNTTLSTWFERDRAYVGLEDLDGRTVIEWWDDDYREAVEDGFLDPRRLHESAIQCIPAPYPPTR